MLVNTQLSGFGGGGTSSFLYDILVELGLTTSLNFCLDAADTRSYDGSSQTWTDIAAGNSFFRGTTSGSEASDPTFNGTAGLPTAATYFSHDGGDLFTETAAHTFPDTWHQNNGKFSLLYVFYPNVGDSGTKYLFANATPGLPHGIVYGLTAARDAFCTHCLNNGGTQETVTTSTMPATQGEWNFCSISFDEASLAANFQTNSSTETETISASTDTDTTFNTAIRLGALGDASVPLPNTARIACCAGWSTNIGTSSLNDVYTRLKARRFTSLP